MYKFNNKYQIKSQRRRLRKDQTRAEMVLWSRLRRKQSGYKFRRQHSFSKYIIDFYCPALLLAIEVDGNIHDEHTQRTYDELRQRYLEEHWIKVIRFKNEQVYYELESVLSVIKKECELREEFLRQFHIG